MSLSYRPDVDGLRAVAVGSVVLFHGHIPPFSGGYIGVDVFFVISGFLITSILARDIAAGRYSIADFYDRRIRRIFPALFLVLAATTLLAALVLMPSQMVTFARSLPAAAFFFANVHFASGMTYFGAAADETPLLHLWSLAVEEQFYIVFPVLLFLLMRFGGRRLALGALTAIAVASLVWAQIELDDRPQMAFYLLSSRAWELLAGALLALVPLPRLPARIASSVGALGLLAIAIPVFTYSKETPFPGIAALPPVLGAVALILAGASAPHGPVSRLLSTPGFVYVGRISYSLYLWHWPLLVLALLYKGANLTHLQAGGIILLSVALSALSLKYVETPFRAAQPFGSARLTRFGAAAALMAAAVVLSAAFDMRGAGLWQNTPRGMVAETAASHLSHFQLRCANTQEDAPGSGFKPFEECSFGERTAEGRYDVLVWGDSHASASFAGFGAAAERYGNSSRVLSMVSCPPLVGGKAANARAADGGRRCTDFNAAVLAEIEQVRPKLVILVGRWSLWTRHARSSLALVSDEVDGGGEKTRDSSARVLAHMLDRTIATLEGMGSRVLLVGQVPEFPFVPPQCVARAEFYGRDSAPCLVQPLEKAIAVVGEGNALLMEAQQRHPASFVLNALEVFCRKGVCPAGEGERFYFVDRDHVSDAGALVIEESPQLDRVLATVLGHGSHDAPEERSLGEMPPFVVSHNDMQPPLALPTLLADTDEAD